MSQQNETPENSEARVLVAHLNMDVDTDQGIKVNINAGREALMYMPSCSQQALSPWTRYKAACTIMTTK